MQAAKRHPGLDGLRAVAVALVLVYHLGHARVLPGSWMGVDLFFALSGFLICGRLLDDTPTLRSFWSRRARRLLPAMAVVVAAYAVIGGALVNVTSATGPTWSAMAGVLWWRLVGLTNVAELHGPRVPALAHLWSLAIEEQFYLLFAPAALLAGVRATRTAKARRVAIASALLGVTSLVWLGVLAWSPTPDAGRLYLLLDTRAAPLLFGATAAAVLRWRRHSVQRHIVALERTTVVLLAFLVAAIYKVDNTDMLTYRYVMPVVSVGFTLVVLLTVMSPRVERWLSWPPLRYLGRRSYGVYLWHLPLAWALAPVLDPWQSAAVTVVLSVVLAELSWRLVERRFLP